jgi:hypothetical protein
MKNLWKIVAGNGSLFAARFERHKSCKISLMHGLCAMNGKGCSRNFRPLI